MAKRGAGEGTIRRRKDGRWEARFVYSCDENGKARRHRGTNLREHAHRWTMVLPVA